MRDRPDARDLLETARQALMEEILPALPPERRYTAHLIGAVLATTAREIAAGEAANEAERAALATLLGKDRDLTTLNRAFAEAIRAGRFDGLDDGRERAYDILVAANRAKLLECNPGYLEG